MKQFIIWSSWGELTIDATTGDVLEWNCDDYLNEVVRVDLEEHKRNGATPITEDGCDILDFGCWDKDGKYGEPEHSWRERIKEDKKILDRQ